MKLLSQGAQYAISAIIAISKFAPDEAISAAELSKSLKCPSAYLSQILAKLKPSGVIGSQRGLKGGVFLAKPLDEITLYEVITAIDGNDFFTQCFMGIEGCGRIEPCPFHTFWSTERDKIQHWLTETTFDRVNEDMSKKWFDLRLQFKTGSGQTNA